MAIAAVSLLVNLMTFPIYSAADARQLEEREIQKKMKPGLDHIKAVFKGDERFMMLAEYYEINHYSPAYALRSSLSILVQVPFFIAAYHFLSKCPELSGVKLGLIDDLMKPDAMLKIGSLSVNILPILMTLINIVSGTIYTRGASLREKVQVYGLAMIFLILLYSSPSGLVFYWTLNNLFSLAKNFIHARGNPRRWVKAIVCLAFVSLCLYMTFFKPRAHIYKKIILYIFTLAVCLACVFSKKLFHFKRQPEEATGAPKTKDHEHIFLLSCIGLCLLIGATIPLSVLGSDPVAFSFLEGYSSPFLTYWPTLAKAAGLFLLWPYFIYRITADKRKPLLSVAAAFIFLSALLNFYAFSSDYGILSDMLVYERDGIFYMGGGTVLLNLLSITLTGILILFLFRKKASKLLASIIMILNISVATHAIVEGAKTQQGYNTALAVLRKNAENVSVEKIDPIFNLSKTGTNVFCIMLDRATGAYLEECFKEDPHLYEQYDGFTFYPNTVSFSYGTVAGSPGLFGGYEYIPPVMNLKEGQPMCKKFEEAISLLPRLFSRNGYSASMTDLPVSNYLDNYYFMDEYPEKIKTFTTIEVYWQNWKKEHGFGSSIQLETDRKRFLPYSIIRACPSPIRSRLYDEGNYLISYYILDKQAVNDRLFFREESFEQTIKNYAVLDYLPLLTQVVEDGDNFVFFTNLLPHSPNYLQVPEYKPVPSITTSSPSKYGQEPHYHVNMASFKLLGKWLDYLKENGAYDNTRIIISADHGCGGGIKEVEGYSHLPTGELTCLLMVKDFTERGRMKVDKTFMTNADVPSIAVKGLIENTINPATGNDITKISLKNPVYGEYTEGGKALRNRKSDKFDVEEETWYSIHDDLFKPENWNKPSSTEVYENTLSKLSEQGVNIKGAAK
ncbi:MAG: YidC/Oxa1 family membrane protein insertase [Treponema sp.]|nr:YidC/Oxa1 family membrane protein insertase [Treponema sp.]